MSLSTAMYVSFDEFHLGLIVERRTYFVVDLCLLFDTCVGLFGHVCMSLSTHMYASFNTYVGLFGHICMLLSTHTWKKRQVKETYIVVGGA